MTDNEKAVKLSPDDLENVTGGGTYTKVDGDRFEVWYRCPKCNKYESLVFCHGNSGHMLKNLHISGIFFCEVCGYHERYNLDWDDD